MSKKQPPKVRNPFVMHAKRRVAGSHEKPYKTERGKAKKDLKKQWLR